MKINELLAAPNSPEIGQALATWAKEIPARILRGDMMIGILTPSEVELVPQALRKAHDCGIAEALLDLALWLTNPPWGEPDSAAAHVAYQQAIATNVPNAQLRFVEFLWFYGRETTTLQEQRDAYHLAEKLTLQTDPDGRALYLLGLLTHQGFGTPADPARAAQMQQSAAGMGNADAMFELFIYFENGIGVPKHAIKAMIFLQQAAEKGHPRAMYNVAACLATGRGIPKDSAKAAEWYTRASEAGNIRATVNLALMYASGEGVEKNLYEAERLFDEAEYMGLDVTAARASVGL